MSWEPHTARGQLRAAILNVISHELQRPRFNHAEKLTDRIVVLVRLHQAQAWRRGYSAGMNNHYFAGYPTTTPYSGGRHADPTRDPQ